MPTLRSWLAKLKNNWNLLTTSATWIAAVAASVVLSPDSVFSDEDALIPWMSKLAIFIIAVLIGITFLLVGKLSLKKHAWVWGPVALLTLGVSVWGVLRYYDLSYSLTCTCGGQKVVKGVIYKDPSLISFMYPQGFDCSKLCERFKDEDGKLRADKVWTEDSINISRAKLVNAYILCFPFIALTVISVSQAIYCNQKGANTANRRGASKLSSPKQRTAKNMKSEKNTDIQGTKNIREK